MSIMRVERGKRREVYRPLQIDRAAVGPPARSSSAGTVLRFIAVVLTLLASTQTAPAQAQVGTRPSYEINATLDTATARLDVSERLTFVNTTGQPLSSIVLRLPPAGLGIATVHRVQAGGQTGVASVDGAVVEAPLSTLLAPGQRATVAIDFSVDLPRQGDRLGVSPRAAMLGNWIATLAVHHGDWDRRPHTNVGDAFVTEVGDFKVVMETAQPLQLAFSGRLVAREDRRWTIEANGVRDVAIVASSQFSTATAQGGSSTITAYSLGTPAQELADRAAELTSWFEARFGPITHGEIKVVEADLPKDYGGMEYPGLIMLAAGYGPLRVGSPYDSLIGHELAHQWFYSHVGSDQIDDPWLDEGFATYAPILYYRENAPDVGRSMVRGLESARTSGPVNASLYDFSNDSSYFAAIYRPGAQFLHEVRGVMGPETFDAAVRDYVSLFGGHLATPRAFLDLLQERTTANLNPLIQRYFSYGAFSYPTPLRWQLDIPESPWTGGMEARITSEFPMTSAELWLDQRRIDRRDVGGGTSAALAADLRGVEPGDYVLLARVRDLEGAQLERARRVTIR